MAAYIDLEGLPSDVFDFDELDLDRPRSVTDYSSWPAESSPAPADAQGEVEYSGNEIEEEYDTEEEEEEEEDHSEDLEDYSEQDGQDDHEHDEHDEHEQNDRVVDEYHELYEAEDEDEFEYVLEDELEEGDFGAEDHWDDAGHQPAPISPAARRGFVELLAEYQARDDQNRLSEAPSDSLFVDRAGNFSPPLDDLNLFSPLETLLSSVRRNHRRALNLVSELHSEAHNRGHSPRPFGQDRASRNSFGRGSVGPARENQRQNQRHHPYGMPQDRAHERGRMADQGRRRNSGLFRDELVELEMQPPRAPMRHNRTPARAQPEVIDLTGEPDTPDEPEAIVAPRARAMNAGQITAGRNPRRQMSLNQRTPSLSRSDGSLLGNHANVIDLTLDDSPAPPPMPLQLPRRDNPEPPRQNRHQRHHHRNRHAARAQPVNLDDQAGFGARLVAGFARRLDLFRHLGLGNQHDVEVQFIGGALDMDNPLAGNAPDLDYRANGNNGPPKPAHVPPPAPRDGFTRDTGAADDVVVCPSCEQELKYDPDSANDDTMSARMPKKPRTRKDQEEHHFWALKDCGHVSFFSKPSLTRALLTDFPLSLKRSTAGIATKVASLAPRTRRRASNATPARFSAPWRTARLMPVTS